MKVRNGFVSNSSSSSFIVGIKTKSIDAKKTYEANKKVMIKYNGKDWFKEMIEDGNDLIPTNYKIISMSSIEYGAEDYVKDLVDDLLSGFGIDKKNIVLKWED